MKKLTKITKQLLSIILVFAMLFSFTSCTFPWEEERDRIFNEIDKLEKSSDYAITTRHEYITATEKIVFNNMVRDKISNDGHKIKKEEYGTFRRLGNFIVFSLKYKSEKRFWGINDSNNYWAVGIISLVTFSIEIHYLKNKYEELSPSFTSNTHLSFDVLDEDKESTDYECLIIERSNEKITILDDLQSTAPEIIGKPIESYRNPNSFVWNGKAYTVSKTIIRDNHKNIVAELNNSVSPSGDSFRYVDILSISPEIQEINKILGEGREDDVACYFFTNGEDLFIGFVTKTSMFGAECNLTCPVIFKTNPNFDSFEYIGCVSASYTYNFYEIVEVERIN